MHLSDRAFTPDNAPYPSILICMESFHSALLGGTIFVAFWLGMSPEQNVELPFVVGPT